VTARVARPGVARAAFLGGYLAVWSGFAAGAMLASLLWFFGLAYGAAWLAPLFRRPVQ